MPGRCSQKGSELITGPRGGVFYWCKNRKVYIRNKQTKAAHRKKPDYDRVMYLLRNFQPRAPTRTKRTNRIVPETTLGEDLPAKGDFGLHIFGNGNVGNPPPNYRRR